jgi:hypothetical protein
MMGFEENKNKLYEYLDKSGIDKEEIDNYFKNEYKVSLDIGLSHDDSNKRALISTTNHYRKYLEKLGNRIKFLCIGISNATDYGISKYLIEVNKKWNDISNLQFRESMISEKIVDEKGRPLHTKDTTLFENQIGTVINKDEMIQQTLYGFIEYQNQHYASSIKLYGKKVCEEKKEMFKWCLLSAEQSASKAHPNWMTFNSKELNMKPIKDLPRISMEDYLYLVNKLYSDIIIDLDEPDQKIKLEDEKTTLVLLKNARLTGYVVNNGIVRSGLISKIDFNDVTAQEVANLTFSKDIEINVDANWEEDIWIFGQVRKKKPTDLKRWVDVFGMYVEHPIDRDKFRISMSDIFGEEVVAPVQKIESRPTSEYSGNVESSNFFNKLKNNNYES